MATNNNGTYRETALRVVAVLGLIAVLLLGAWGIIQLAFFIPSFFSDAGGNISRFFRGATQKESLSISLPRAITSGSVVPLAWRHQNGDGEYSYAISYSCATGLSMKAPLPNGQAQAVVCNTPFNFTNATSSTRVAFELTGSKPATTTITVTATKLDTGTIAATATTGTTVSLTATTTKPVATTPEGTDTKPSGTDTKPTPKPTTSKPTTTYYPSGRTQNLYGYGDLAVRINQAPQGAQNGQRISLVFTIENAGTNIVPQGWSFTALLPYNPVYTYQSVGQQPLYPGDRIVYTLSYDASAQYQGGYGGTPVTATIHVDPYNQVQEQSEYNNSVQATYTVY